MSSVDSCMVQCAAYSLSCLRDWNEEKNIKWEFHYQRIVLKNAPLFSLDLLACIHACIGTPELKKKKELLDNL